MTASLHGLWWLKQILVFSLSLDQAEQYSVTATTNLELQASQRSAQFYSMHVILKYSTAQYNSANTKYVKQYKS